MGTDIYDWDYISQNEHNKSKLIDLLYSYKI